MAEISYITGAPPFPFGSIARHGRGKFVLRAGLSPLNLGAHEGRGYLLRLTAFDSTAMRALPRPFPFGSISRRVPRHWATPGAVLTTYPAATGNAERSTADDDTPAATWVPGKLAGNWNYSITVASGVAPTAGGSSSLGILEIIDPDGELDALRTLALDGAELVLLRGDPEAYFDTYTAVARLTAAGIRGTTARKEILVRDQTWRLDTAELHGQRYAGTGGVEGDSDLAGQMKPIGFGVVFNATPKLISAARLIHQVSCTSVLAIDAVKDGGVALSSIGDFATYAALDAATINPGEYATCLAEGLFRLGGKPEKICTVDFRGDNDAIAGGPAYPHTRAQIVRRIACGRGSVRLTDPGDIDTAAFEALEVWQPATLGYYWTEAITKAEAIAEVMAGCAGWWTVRLNGRLAVGQLEDPALAVPDFTLSYPSDDDTAESRVDAPEVPDYAPPRKTTVMGFARNYTPMTDDQIAGAAAADAVVLKGDASYVTIEDAWVSVAYPSAAVVTITSSGFAFGADAGREANRQARLFRTRREPYRIPAVIDPFGDVVCRVAAVTAANRLGLSTSRNVFIHGIEVNGGPKAVLRGWS